jgi:hypothetical protein
MMFNWIVSAMQSEDNITLDSLKNYSADESFTNMAGRIISGSNNSSWTKGDGMWSWANKSLYEGKGLDILNLSYIYKYDEKGNDPWYIVDNATLQKIWCYNINYADSGTCKNE